MKTHAICCVSALALVSALGCTEDDFDPGSRVTTLRVLAVQADRPYAAPGETVRLSALSLDPLGRTIQWAWAACENPSTSDVEGCLDKIAQDTALGATPLLASGESVDTLELTIPPSTLDALPPEALPAAMIGVVSIACPGEIELETSTAGLPFRCIDGASGDELPLDEYVIGLKRIFVRSSDQNQNPSIERVTFDGEDWPADVVQEVDSCDTDEFVYDDCKDKGSHQLAAVVSDASFESGIDEFGRDFAEDVIVQHYNTDGIFQYEVRIGEEPTTGWVARSSASGSDVPIWFVARDDRGGVSYTSRTVHVR
jgi:hypothetical protein